MAAIIQDRRGPNRAGPAASTLADGLSVFFKEEIIPNFFFQIPLLSWGRLPAMLTADYDQCGCSLGDKVQLLARISPADRRCQHRPPPPPPPSSLFVFSVVSLGVYGIMIGSWAAIINSLMGGLRAASQIIS